MADATLKLLCWALYEYEIDEEAEKYYQKLVIVFGDENGLPTLCFVLFSKKQFKEVLADSADSLKSDAIKLLSIRIPGLHNDYLPAISTRTPHILKGEEAQETFQAVIERSGDNKPLLSRIFSQ